MAFQPCPNIMEVQVHFSLANEPVECVHHYQKTAGIIGGTDAPDLANAVAAVYQAHILPILAADLVLTHVYARDLTTQFSVVGDSGIVDVAGGAGVGVVPNNVTIAVSWRTGLAGRGNRGRTYIPGIPSAVVTQNLVSNTFASNALVAYGFLLAPSPLPPFELIVLSRHFMKVLRANGVAIPITSLLFTDQEVDSQRDRLPAHKRKSHGP